MTTPSLTHQSPARHHPAIASSAQPDHQDHQDPTATLDHPDSLEIQDSQEATEAQDSPDPVDHQETPEPQETMDNLDNPDSQERTAPEDKEDLEHPDQQDRQETLEIQEPPETTASQEHPDHRDLPEAMETQVAQETTDNQVHQVDQASPVRTRLTAPAHLAPPSSSEDTPPDTPTKKFGLIYLVQMALLLINHRNKDDFKPY